MMPPKFLDRVMPFESGFYFPRLQMVLKSQ